MANAPFTRRGRPRVIPKEQPMDPIKDPIFEGKGEIPVIEQAREDFTTTPGFQEVGSHILRFMDFMTHVELVPVDLTISQAEGDSRALPLIHQHMMLLFFRP